MKYDGHINPTIMPP